jgi:hypothetical protein
VTDANDRPIPGVLVTAHAGFATRWKTGVATTDANGGYSFVASECGSMIFDEAHQRWDHYIGLTLSGTTWASADGQSWWDVRVPNVAGQRTSQDFAMIPGGFVEGVLLDAASGVPVSHELRIFTGSQDSMGFFRWVSCDADGRFREQGLFPGSYTVDVNSVEHDYPIVGEFRVRPGERAQVTLSWDRGP